MCGASPLHFIAIGATTVDALLVVKNNAENIKYIHCAWEVLPPELTLALSVH